MKVLTIGTDRNLFDKRSSVLERQKEYAKELEEFHIIVFSTKEKNLKLKIIDNLFIYPTNSRSRWFYVFDAWRIGKSIAKEKNLVRGTSVVSAQDPFESGLVAYLIARKFKLPILLQIHTDFLTRQFKSGLNKVRIIIAKFLIPRAQSIRVVSNTLAYSIKNQFSSIRDRIRVLPVFVDIESILNYESKKDIRGDFLQFSSTILMASRLTKEKRIDIAMRSFEKVLKESPNIGLIIAGEGKERSNLELLVKQLNISSNVLFVGWQDDLISYMKMTDIFLLTSEYEGYGMVLIEAGAAGCAIVTTRVGIAKTDLLKNGENSFVCPVGDVDALANRVIELLKDVEKRNLFKRNIKDSIEKISITKKEYIKQYIGLLEEIV